MLLHRIGLTRRAATRLHSRIEHCTCTAPDHSTWKPNQAKNDKYVHQHRLYVYNNSIDAYGLLALRGRQANLHTSPEREIPIPVGPAAAATVAAAGVVTASAAAAAASTESDDTADSASSDAPSSMFTYEPRDLDLSQPLPALKYPVVLVHGYLGYASLLRSPRGEPLLEYFGSVRTHLKSASNDGITLLTPVNPPAASIAARAKKLQLALGIKKIQMKETPISGDSDATIREPIASDNSSSSSSSSSSTSSIPVEFRNTGGMYDAKGEIGDAKLRAAAATAASESRVSTSSSRAQSGTNSSKTRGEAREEARAETETEEGSDPGFIVLGGKEINLNQYTGKFHLISHSMGGLDCRYLISHLQSGQSSTGSSNHKPSPHANRICSLTTIATPHRGSPVADMVLEVIDVPLSFNSDPAKLKEAPTFNKFSQWIAGLFHIDVTGISNLSTSSMYEFNTRIKDHPDVYYQSYGGAKRFSWASVWFWPSLWIRKYASRCQHELVHKNDPLCAGGENDGLVSVSSAKWGTYKGTTRLDHLEQIGLGVMHKHLPLYRQIIFSLHEIEQKEEEETARLAAKDDRIPPVSAD